MWRRFVEDLAKKVDHMGGSSIVKALKWTKTIGQIIEKDSDLNGL